MRLLLLCLVCIRTMVAIDYKDCGRSPVIYVLFCIPNLDSGKLVQLTHVQFIGRHTRSRFVTSCYIITCVQMWRQKSNNRRFVQSVRSARIFKPISAAFSKL
ncbi:hypothetical protein CSKR_110744 [Clonorchis sinensis]|uniref:Uncharacterized protein n=1 Tax=Clonorchis sinensis TaxID=79923 RepID=A0A3R7H3X1_CLOSI|nr:hypothetical protein CSKR_110744 [Clonorchis sinensis]